MINKLKSKIFYILMISLSTITLGIIILFTYYNYRNTINTSTFFIDRVFGGREQEEGSFIDRPPLNEIHGTYNNEDINDDKIEKNEIPEIEGFYSLVVKDSNVISRNNNESEEIKNYAIEVSKKKIATGIIGNYIYRIERQRDNEIRINLVENEDAINRIKLLIAIGIVVSLLSLIIIYIISKKISQIIVKPVEETFSKQVQFISDASHELKTPLAVIEANADVLENEQGNSKWLTYIQNEIESMNKLINELLLLAKIENIDSMRHREKFSVSKETEMVVSMFESMAFEKGVKIKTNIKEDVKLLGSREDIEHILSTIVDNAIKHTNEKGNVLVELQKEQNNIVLQVKNEGDPIPKEERDKIFERFYRVDKARNRNEKRYGLGLAIAKSTVEKYNGTIGVDYNEGYTIFKVRIPLG